MGKLSTNGYSDSLFPTGKCYICGFAGDLVRHEIFHGANRQKSKKYGCWVNLCVRCHQDLHEHPASYRWLQTEAQMLAMREHGWNEEVFRIVFGKSYL